MARPRQRMSISKLAEEAGVSHMTVSRVLNNRAGVSEEVRAKIKALQLEYKYKTNYHASRKAKVALVTSTSDLTYYHRKLFHGVARYAADADIEVTFLFKSPDEPDLMEQIRDSQCSGLIISLAWLYSSAYNDFNDSGLPAMLIDARCDLPNVGYVDNASYEGSRRAAEYLLENGHRAIGYLLHGMNSLGNHPHRLAGYRDALNAAGIDIPSRWIQPVNELKKETGLPYWENVPFAVRRLLEQAPELTAVMTVDDSLALRCAGDFAREGVRIPDDLSLVGFDDAEYSKYWYPGITTVTHNLEDAGFIAAEALDFAMSNPGDWRLPKKVLPTELVIRDSVKTLKT